MDVISDVTIDSNKSFSMANILSVASFSTAHLSTVGRNCV